MNIALVQSSNNPEQNEISLAAKLGISLLKADEVAQQGIQLYLRYDPEGLGLYSTQADISGAVRVNFQDAKLNFRVGNSAKNQNIVKAIGIRGSTRPRVLDATAGLGKDAYLLASLGCEVQMLERSAVVHALLEDGMQRALSCDDKIVERLSRMQLLKTDFLDFVRDSASDAEKKYDVIYLDPMFPARSKTARVKKDMYLLQQMLGHDEGNMDPVFSAARALAQKRVVVKRAKLSPYLTAEKPDIEFKASSSRYDVYLSS